MSESICYQYGPKETLGFINLQSNQPIISKILIIYKAMLWENVFLQILPKIQKLIHDWFW